MKPFDTRFFVSLFLWAAMMLICPGLLHADATRSVTNDGTCTPTVEINVTPGGSTLSYAVDERLPAGLRVSNISHGGLWNESQRLVHWGPFDDNSSRTLTYDVTGPDTTYGVGGSLSEDGNITDTGGSSAVTVVCNVPRQQVEAPVPAPGSGADAPVDVAISCGTPGAQIYYTLDGTVPDLNSILYSAPVHVTERTTLRVRAFMPGMDPSETVTAVYNDSPLYTELTQLIDNTSCPPVLTVNVTPQNTDTWAVEEELPGGFYPSSVNENGEWDPTTRKIKWGPFDDTSARTLTCELVGESGTYSIVPKASFNGRAANISGDTTVTVDQSCTFEQVARPSIFPPSGTESPVTVTITDTTPGAEIYYSTGGDYIQYTGSFTISQETTVRARAYADGMLRSKEAEAYYAAPNLYGTVVRAIQNGTDCSANVTVTATPYSNPDMDYGVVEEIPAGLTPSAISQGGVWDSARHEIRWGTWQDDSSRVFEYTLTGSPGSHNLTGHGSFYGYSRDTSGDYQALLQCNPVLSQVADPVISPASGSSLPVDVTITCSTTGAEIRYTTDGSIPDASSALYTGSLHFTTTTALRARAFNTGMEPSDTVSADYGVAEPAWASSAERQVSGSGECNPVVSISVDPETGVRSWAVTEQIPPGYTPTAINNGGVWDSINSTILWGAFNGDSPLVLSYTLGGPDGMAATTGTLSFDGSIVQTTGPASAAVQCFSGQQVETPVISPATGTPAPVDVSITCATSGAEIRYTNDGSLPDGTSALYTGTIQLDGAATVRARAFMVGWDPSDTATSFFPENSVENTVERSVQAPADCIRTVTFDIVPDSHTLTYALEQQVPDGLVAGNISNQGVWDADTKTVRWGPFDSADAVQFSFDLAGLSGAYTLQPLHGSFNGVGGCYGGTTLFDNTCNLAPDITASVTSIAFGDMTLGAATPYQTVIFSNIGDYNLVINALKLTGTHFPDFSRINDTCTGAVLAPQETCSVEVAFNPSATGNRSAAVTVDSTDPDEPSFSVPLYGTGTNDPVLSITVAGSGNGTVTDSFSFINCPGTCSSTYNTGDTVTLTAVQDAGSVFAGWSGDADCADGGITMNAAVTCTATFNIELDSDGDGYTPSDGDCDDADANVYPGAVELCDGIDNDCDVNTADGSGEA